MFGKRAQKGPTTEELAERKQLVTSRREELRSELMATAMRKAREWDALVQSAPIYDPSACCPKCRTVQHTLKYVLPTFCENDDGEAEAWSDACGDAIRTPLYSENIPAERGALYRSCDRCGFKAMFQPADEDQERSESERMIERRDHERALTHFAPPPSPLDAYATQLAYARQLNDYNAHPQGVLSIAGLAAGFAR